MTSISSTMPGFPMPPSPRARIDARIAAAASAGTISRTDGTAMETAVDAIGRSLRSGGSIAMGAGGTAATTSGSGTSFKDKPDGLIDAQVTSGTLTDAQAMVAVSATDTATRQLDTLIGFLEKMRESIGSAQTYGTGSAHSSGTDAAGMVFSGIA
ncbi:hypothetical protein [uncultured Sphingomonas sp.]|uniref:hypothetical protein n=1 Tax=uncultured Sphingomonas sp. TaxID=158754 RepID=UPI0035CA2766